MEGKTHIQCFYHRNLKVVKMVEDKLRTMLRSLPCWTFWRRRNRQRFSGFCQRLRVVYDIRVSQGRTPFPFISQQPACGTRIKSECWTIDQRSIGIIFGRRIEESRKTFFVQKHVKGRREADIKDRGTS